MEYHILSISYDNYNYDIIVEHAMKFPFSS